MKTLQNKPLIEDNVLPHDSIGRIGVRGIAQVAAYIRIMDTFDTDWLPLSV